MFLTLRKNVRKVFTAASHDVTNKELYILKKQRKNVRTCVCATGVAPLFSCDRKKRMDMKSSWTHTRNSSSFWPPVASEKRRRDWMMYLKMYSLACTRKQGQKKSSRVRTQCSS